MTEPSEPSADPLEIEDELRKDRLRAALFEEPMKQRRLGRYRVVGTLGRGGMGTVLEAVDDTLGRRIALKILHRDVSELDQKRLLREAQALAAVSHPNVVQVHEVGEHPRPFIAMELVRGQTLAEWQRERRPWRDCVRAYLQAGRGLAAAHAQRLIHRDFKPGNCIIDDEQRVRVMDFGLARSLGSVPHSDASQDQGTDPTIEPSALDSSLTETGAMMGTLAYMSLEQLEGREVDARSDQFAFCVALFEALYGRRPFAGRTAGALAEVMRREELPASEWGASPPRALRRVLLRGLCARAERRWPSMDALLLAIERVARPRWRRRLGAAVVVAGLGSAGASIWWVESRTEQTCAGASEQLRGVWDEARRAQVREALLASELPYAADAWLGVESRLDAYGRAWESVWLEVCEASRVHHDRPESVAARQTACLHERKVALREAVEVLGGDAPVVERAVGLVSKLPALERCTDVPALLAQVPPPEEAQARAHVQELRDRVAEARALRIGGRYARSLEVLDEVAPEAAQLGYVPLEAEVDLGRGWAQYGMGHHEEARAAFEAAYFQATVEGHDAVATSAAAMLAYLFGDVWSKHEQGLQWGTTARAHAMRPGAEPGAEGTALANVAAVQMRAGNNAAARATYEDALARLEEAFGPNDVQLAFTLNGLAIAHLGLDETSQALATHRRALELRRESLGPRHPHVAMSLNNLGVVYHRLSRFEEADEHFRRALEIKEAILGADHPDLVSSIINLGGIAQLRRDYEGALVLYRRALSIAERAHGEGSAVISTALHNLASVYEELDRRDEARAMYLRALELGERMFGPRNAELINTLEGLARLDIDDGELRSAAAYAQRALAVADEVLPAGSPQRADVLLIQSVIAREQGRPTEALELARNALALREEAGQALPALVMSRVYVAEALASIDEAGREEALRMLDRALRDLSSVSGPMVERQRARVEAAIEGLTRRDPPR